jgi:ABC-type glycerol-3-phosphate transport system substrate-binding protein
MSQRTSRFSGEWVKVVLVLGVAVLAGAAFVWWMKPKPIPDVTIRIVGEASSNLNAMIKSGVAHDFEREQHVKVQFVPQTFEQLQKSADEDLQAGTGTYDIILNYNFSLAPYVRNGWVLPFDSLKMLAGNPSVWDAIESDLIDKAWREVGYFRATTGPGAQAQPVGYPFATNTMLLCYNRALFADSARRERYQHLFHESLEPPRDWAHFERLAKFFTDSQTHGVVLQGGSGGWLYYEWTNFAFGNGGGVMRKTWGWEGDDRTPLLLTTPQTIEATQLYMRLKPYNLSNDFFSTGALEQRELLGHGKVAMALLWSDYAYGLLYDKEQHDDDFGFAPIPGDRSMLAGGAFYVNDHSKYKREAAKFIQYVLQRPQQVRMMRVGLASPLRSAYDDSIVRQLPYSSALHRSLERGVYMLEAGSDADAVLQVLTTHLQRMWRGTEAVDRGLAAAAGEIDMQRRHIYSRMSDTSKKGP